MCLQSLRPLMFLAVASVLGAVDPCIGVARTESTTTASTGPGPSASDLAEAIRLFDACATKYLEQQFDVAKQLCERVLEIRERIQGHSHPDVALTLTALARVHYGLGDYAGAQVLARRALKLREEALGAAHPDVATPLGDLALMLEVSGEYDAAESLYRRVIAIQERALGPDHLYVATSLNNLAVVLQAKGDYDPAELFLRRSLDIREKALGPKHPDVAVALTNLSNLLRVRGDYSAAESLQRRGLKIWEDAFGPDDLRVATAMNNLALVIENRGAYAEAEKLLSRALTIRERELGAQHPDLVNSMNNLATLYHKKGDYIAAEPLMRRALETRIAILGPMHPDTVVSLANLAALLHGRSNYNEALRLYRDGLSISENAFGPEHPRIAELLVNIAVVSWDAGDRTAAQENVSRAVEIGERHLIRTIHALPERQALAFVDTLRGPLELVLALQSERPTDPSLARLGLTILLRRKGRVLDAIGRNLDTVRRHASRKDREQFDQLQSKRAQLAALERRGQGARPLALYITDLRNLTAEIATLEAALHAKGGMLTQLASPVHLADVQRRIPNDAALIEFVHFRANSRSRIRGEERLASLRYGAYVLRAVGEPVWVDLGDAESLEALITEARAVLRRPTSPELLIQGHAGALYQRVLAPLAPAIGHAAHLLVSPDGLLNLVSFEALYDPDGFYLIENYTVTYLGSGRDLLRMDGPRPTTGTPVVVAAPDFDAVPNAAGHEKTTVAEEQLPRLSVDWRSGRWKRLPGAFAEAQEVAVILGSKASTGGRASEEVVKSVRSPSILHIATHAFYLSDQPTLASLPSSLLFLNVEALDAPSSVRDVVRAENPLLRSGLVLAGANRSTHTGEDGILTALEFSGLDLWGTQLVVLSACDTGLGAMMIGEGVYGLRRAVSLAGAHTLVASLWKANDLATKQVMVRYYQHLQAGLGRSEALRQTQIELIHHEQWHHPAYWAGFISNGDWRPLQFQRWRRHLSR